MITVDRFMYFLSITSTKRTNATRSRNRRRRAQVLLRGFRAIGEVEIVAIIHDQLHDPHGGYWLI